MKNIPITIRFTILLLILNSFARVNGQDPVNRDTVILAAHEIINQTTYCGLGTVDSLGQPQIRTMNPFPVGDDFLVWFATSRSSRKVREIKVNPNVSVYFADHLTAKGYVNICGSASVIDDKKLLTSMKREYWNDIKGWQEKFVLIKITPKSVEVINYKFGLNNDPNTFKAPMINF
ncbi:MAG TPA: pyridoxamine 5'-phosphate oxidase family protein [Bacteroidales bacterium]|nr:pyridoxamine 5'-phosphate oxidase family protein [Bacteroidales bacterium]